MTEEFVSVDLEGLQALSIQLEGVATASQINRIAEEAGAVLLNRIRTRFLDGIDADGVPWPPSRAGLIRQAGGYTYRNGKAYTSTGTLFETGTLFHSIQLSKAESGVASISTDVPYAKDVQEGEGGIPARPFLEVGDEDAAFISEYLASSIQRILSNA